MEVSLPIAISLQSYDKMMQDRIIRRSAVYALKTKKIVLMDIDRDEEDYAIEKFIVKECSNMYNVARTAVKEYIRERVLHNQNGKLHIDRLYEDFTKWCKNNWVLTLTKPELHVHLTEFFNEKNFV